jgi:hypothetical protein
MPLEEAESTCALVLMVVSSLEETPRCDGGGDFGIRMALYYLAQKVPDT